MLEMLNNLAAIAHTDPYLATGIFLSVFVFPVFGTIFAIGAAVQEYNSPRRRLDRQMKAWRKRHRRNHARTMARIRRI